MVVRYTYDESQIHIAETKNAQDVTFEIEVKSEEMRNRLKQVRAYFDENKDYTDAFFFTHQNGKYEVIVRNNMRLAFLLQAFRFRCLESLSWQ